MGRKMLKIKDEWKGKQKHAPNPHIVRDAARHNLREIQAELGAESSIDSERSRYNEILVGPITAAEVVASAGQRMRDAGIDPKKFRVDGVRIVEVVCSLPPDFGGDGRAYFTECVAWAGTRYGGANNVVSAVIHRDEAQLHCHILLVPLLDGHMAGSDMASYKPKVIEADQIDFHERVASRHGLRSPTRHLGHHAKAALAAAVVRTLRAQDDPVLKSRAWAAFRAAIEANPQQFADDLDVSAEVAPRRMMKTMAQTFTSTGKGPKKEPNPIWFENPKLTDPYPVYGSQKSQHLHQATCRADSPDDAVTGQMLDGAVTDTVTVAFTVTDTDTDTCIDIDTFAINETDTGPNTGTRIGIDRAGHFLALGGQETGVMAGDGNDEHDGHAFGQASGIDSLVGSRSCVTGSGPAHAAEPPETCDAPPEGCEVLDASLCAPAPDGEPPRHRGGTLTLEAVPAPRSALASTSGKDRLGIDLDTQITRVREGDTSADQWDEQLGDFAPVVAPPASRCRLFDTPL